MWIKFGKQVQNDIAVTMHVKIEIGARISIWHLFCFQKPEVVIFQPRVEISPRNFALQIDFDLPN